MINQSQPFFITGANAKVMVDGQILAYCTNVNYRVDIPNRPIHVLGVHEPLTILALTYSVVGSFSIIRYTKGGNDYIAGGNMNDDGNSVGKIDTIGPQLDPFTIIKQKKFELLIYPKQYDINDPTSTYVARVQDCKVINKVSGIIKRSVLTDVIQFQGCYLSDDGSTAHSSKIADGDTNHEQWTDKD